MSDHNKSDSSTSESEVSACSSKYEPMKALYSDKVVIPVKTAPVFENIMQFEAAQKRKSEIIPFGHSDLVQKREQEKIRVKEETERLLLEKNKQRFAKYEGMVATTPKRIGHNVLTRIADMKGPLSTLKECVDKRIRVKLITRNEKSVRGVLHATVVAFDKQWNMALTDVLEIWKRKGCKKRKVPPALGTPVEKGTAAKISPVPTVTETPLGNGVWECTRHVPQLMVRGEHVVLVNIVER